MTAKPILYSFWRSSASYRVRIALAFKGIDYEYRAIHLRKAEQGAAIYISEHPQGLVPALHWTDGTVLTQSLAIVEFLDEKVPGNPLMPPTPEGRARVRSIAQLVACDVHPINNLRVLLRLREQFGADDEAVAFWYRHWAHLAFGALEAILSQPETGQYCHGDAVSLADICVTAQMANNARFAVDLSAFPRLARIVASCETLPAFVAASPVSQPDAE